MDATPKECVVEETSNSEEDANVEGWRINETQFCEDDDGEESNIS